MPAAATSAGKRARPSGEPRERNVGPAVSHLPPHAAEDACAAGAEIGRELIVAITALAMALALLVLGSFLDGMALMLLTTPIFLPIIEQLGMSPIWFGIFLVRTMEIGFVHPPVGMNVYVIHGIAKDIPLTTIFKGIVPFLLTDFLHLALLIAFPAIALTLPRLLGM